MSKTRHKLAASSFCVYLFGLESLAANSEGFLFLRRTGGFIRRAARGSAARPAGTGSTDTGNPSKIIIYEAYLSNI